MLIHVNGMPGVGKLTVAKILTEKLNGHLIDNHILINAARSPGHEHGSEDYLRTLEKITEVVYGELLRPNAPRILLLTNALASKWPKDIARFDRIAALARDRNEPFVPVHLKCSVEENLRRGMSPCRKDKQKLVDADELRETLRKYTINHPYNHPHQLEIDTTNLSAEQTADLIYSHVQRLNPKPFQPAAQSGPHPLPMGDG